MVSYGTSIKKAQRSQVSPKSTNFPVDLPLVFSHLSLETHSSSQKCDNISCKVLTRKNKCVDKRTPIRKKKISNSHVHSSKEIQNDEVASGNAPLHVIGKGILSKNDLKKDTKAFTKLNVPHINSTVNSITSIYNVSPQMGSVEMAEVKEEHLEEFSENSVSTQDYSWISWFCSQRGNEFFCKVDEDYIRDNFNLTGLNILVPYYNYALDMVLDVEIPFEDNFTLEQHETVEKAAEMLYGLIHARYILTNRGMHAMSEKYRSAAFGRCPHVFCLGQPVLPVGLSDLPRNYTVNVFCPRCHGLFFPQNYQAVQG